MKPDFIGIGAQKCATSWLHEVLNGHSEVFTSDPKEIDFFSYYYDKGYEWYERHFEAAPINSKKGETSPSYFYNPAVPKRVSSYHPDMNIIVSFRDPVERAFSNHLHEVRAGNISGDCAFSDGIANNPCYIEQSLYSKHIMNWLSEFPSNQVKCIIFEDIVEDNQGTMNQICDFIGVTRIDSADLLGRKSNASVDYRFKGLQRVIQFGGHSIRRAGLTAPLERFKKAPVVRDLLSFNKVDLRKEVPKMTEDERVYCIELLQEDVHSLCDILKRNSLPWKNFF